MMWFFAVEYSSFELVEERGRLRPGRVHLFRTRQERDAFVAQCECERESPGFREALTHSQVIRREQLLGPALNSYRG